MSMPPPLPKPNWWSRNWKWFVPVIVLTFMLTIAFFFATFFGFIMKMMSSSEPYQTAMSRAQQDRQVIAALGEPLKPGWFTAGSTFSGADGSGLANLDIPLSGPRGDAHLYVDGVRQAGQWHYKTMVVVIPARDLRVDLREPDDSVEAP